MRLANLDPLVATDTTPARSQANKPQAANFNQTLDQHLQSQQPGQKQQEGSSADAASPTEAGSVGGGKHNVLGKIQNLLKQKHTEQGTVLTAAQIKHLQQLLVQISHDQPLARSSDDPLLAQLDISPGGDSTTTPDDLLHSQDMSVITSAAKPTVLASAGPGAGNVVSNNGENDNIVPNALAQLQQADAEENQSSVILSPLTTAAKSSKQKKAELATTMTANQHQAIAAAELSASTKKTSQPAVSFTAALTNLLDNTKLAPKDLPTAESSAEQAKLEFGLLPNSAGLATSQPSAPVSTSINAPLASEAWQQALGQQLLMFSRNGVQNAEIRLHPKELGMLQINLQLSHGQAQLHIAAEHGQARAAIEASLVHLRTSLAEGGIDLTKSSVGADMSSLPWGQHASQNENSRQSPTGQQTQPRTAEPTIPDSAASQHIISLGSVGSGGIDIFA